MKKILFLSFYFRPDLCAGSFRNSPLLDELARKADPEAVSIDVFTTQPQRYSSYNQEAPESEKHGNVRIERVALPRHQSGIKDQIRAFREFYGEVTRRTKGESYDLVYASSSRLFTAYLGYAIAKKLGAPLYLDIRDIFVDTIRDVVRSRAAKLMVLPVLGLIERRVFQYASHINLISAGFLPYFSRYSGKRFSYFTNGIDDLFIEAGKLPASDKKSGKKRILYAGNIGDGQGLHKVIPQVAALLGDAYEIVVIGDGGAKKLLTDKMRESGVRNVILKAPVNRQALIEEYQAADFLFIHLNDYPAFKKVLPSKIFELGALRKQIVAGVGGYAHDFLKTHLPDTILFAPGDFADMARQILAKGNRIEVRRDDFIKAFRREAINSSMADSILSYIGGRAP